MKLGTVVGILAVIGLIAVVLVSSPVESSQSCDPSYPDLCIPEYPPDLDCGHVGVNDFRVLQPDPHGFDADRDGIGCETYP